MDATGTLALRSDVLLIPVTELDSRTRQSIGCDDEDVAISRPQSRMPSTVVDAGAAALIEQFRTPRTLVEAVMLFAAPRRLDPAVVLEDAYRLVRQMVEQGVLVAPEAAAGPPTEGGVMLAQYRRGDLVGDVEVVRALQVVEDAEIYVARHPSAGACVLKVQRTGAHASVTHLGHEAQVLARLAGHAAPALIACDVVDDRVRLLMEHCRGVEAEFAAAECRSLEADALTRMLSLLRHIARAYAVLHAHGVCHGDVHPRNVLVDAHLGVRVIDFGLASLSTAHGAEPTSPPRGGIAFFSEPEAARALLDGQPFPPVTMTGEQYSVAALLFYLLTGGHHVDFSLGRQELLQEIATAPPVTFAARGLPAWPDLEACLQQALSKEPDARFPSMDAFADALDAVEIPALATGMPAVATATPRAALRAAADAVLADTALEAPWFVDGLSQGPTASLNYGAAGVAWALARVAQIRQDAALLARADAWACRARLLADTDPAAFLNPGGEITPESVGRFTPLHTMSGVAAVEALVAWMRGDDDAHHRAVAAFITAVQSGMTDDEGQADVPAMQLDLALGRGSVLVGAGQLLQTLPRGRHPLRRALTSVGDEQLAALWRVLDDTPPIAESRYDNLGMAHGWAGFLHATLQWCHDTAQPLPRGVVPRLEQLAALAEPSGRGLVWPWTLVRGSDANYMPGWCNGSAGYVHLWTLGAHVLHDTSYEALAEGAAWDVWDAQDAAGTLCCGLAGRAYALLAMHRHGGDAAWLERAGILGERAAHGRFEDDYPHSLYKGRMVLPVLAADLDHPFGALHPCFALPLTPA